jgi:hypothetical protein
MPKHISIQERVSNGATDTLPTRRRASLRTVYADFAANAARPSAVDVTPLPSSKPRYINLACCVSPVRGGQGPGRTADLPLFQQ